MGEIKSQHTSLFKIIQKALITNDEISSVMQSRVSQYALNPTYNIQLFREALFIDHPTMKMARPGGCRISITLAFMRRFPVTRCEKRSSLQFLSRYNLSADFINLSTLLKSISVSSRIYGRRSNFYLCTMSLETERMSHFLLFDSIHGNIPPDQ